MVDMMDVGWGELLLLAVVALLIFGPDKLPKAAADAGRMVRKLRELASTAQKDLSPDLDMEGLKNYPRSVAALRRAGYRTEFSYQRQAVGKQMAKALMLKS